jgi:hypothetical protein
VHIPYLEADPGLRFDVGKRGFQCPLNVRQLFGCCEIEVLGEAPDIREI